MAEKKVFTGYNFQGGGQSKNLRLESSTDDPTNVGKGHLLFNTTAGKVKVATVDAGTETFKSLQYTDDTIATSRLTGDIDADTLDSSSKSNALGDTTIPVRDSSNLFHVGTATEGTHVTNKDYVDGVAQGLTIIDPCYHATSAVLPTCTYANGTDGVGATLTGDANGALTIDGTAASAGKRVLVKDQSNAAHNGIYTVTNAGADGSAAFVLTRATDYDAASEINDGDFVFVQEGTLNANRGFVQTLVTWTTAGTFGSTDIVWTQFSGAGQITAGDGLAKSGDTLSVDLAASTPLEFASNKLSMAAIDTGDLADDAVEPAKLLETGDFTMGGLTVNGATTIDGTTAIKDGNRLELWNDGNSNYSRIESSASGVIDFSTGGVINAMYLANDGKLGIGTDSPDTLLEIVGADPVLTIRDTETTGANASSILRLAESGASDTLGNHWDIELEGSVAGGDLVFKHRLGSTTTSALRLATSGDATFGTTSDPTDVKIEGGLGIGTNETTAGSIKAKADGARIQLESNDYVIAALTRQGTTGNAADQGALELYVAGTPKVALYANATSYFTGGNLAIGGTTANELLQVSNTGTYDDARIAITSGNLGDSELLLGDVSDRSHGKISYWNRADNETSPAVLALKSAMSFTTHGVENLRLKMDGELDQRGNPIVNSSTVQGLQDGAAYDFDGTDDAVDLNADPIGTGDVTVAAWINTDGYGEASLGYILDKNTATFYIKGAETQLYFSRGNTPTGAGVGSYPASYHGKWNHVVATATAAGVVNLYINGVLTGTADQDGGTPGTSGATDVFIGNNAAGSRSFDGQIRDVKIFPSALAAADVRKLYSGENPKKNLNVELVTNGGFDSNMTGWTVTAGASSSITSVSGQAKMVDAASSVCRFDTPSASPITTVSGKHYLVKVTLGGDRGSNGGTGSWFQWFIGTSYQGNQYHSPAYGSTDTGGGDHQVFFKATGTTAFIGFNNGNDGGYITVDNVSITEVATLVDFNPRSASTTKWYNAAIPSLYNGTLNGGVTLSAGSTDHRVNGDLEVDGDLTVTSGNITAKNSSDNLVLGCAAIGNMYLGGGNANTQNIILQTGTSERMRIDSTGNTSLTGALTVTGLNSRLQGDTAGSGALIYLQKYTDVFGSSAGVGTVIDSLNTATSATVPLAIRASTLRLNAAVSVDTTLAVTGDTTLTGALTGTTAAFSGTISAGSGSTKVHIGSGGIYNNSDTTGVIYLLADSQAKAGIYAYGSTHATKDETVEIRAGNATRLTISKAGDTTLTGALTGTSITTSSSISTTNGNLTVTRTDANATLEINPTVNVYSNVIMKGAGLIANGLDILAGQAKAYFSADAHYIRNAAQDTNYGVFSSTGLAVTGAVSATTTINGALNGTLGATTPATVAATTVNASGNVTTNDYFINTRGSVDWSLLGSGANFLLLDGATTRVSFSSTGLAVTGAISATTTLDVTGDTTLTGNLGVGVSPIAWGGAYVTGVADLNAGGAIYGTSNGVSLASNLYYDGTDWKQKVSGSSGNLYAAYNAAYYWYTSNNASTAQLSTRMKLDTTGLKVYNNLGVGGDPSASFQLYTTSTMSNVASFASSHSTYGRIMVNAATADADSLLSFQSEGSSMWSIGNNAGDSAKFQIRTSVGALGGTATKFTLDTSGNCGIGTVTPTAVLDLRPTALADGFGDPDMMVGAGLGTLGKYATIGFGWRSAASNKAPAEIGFISTDTAGGTKGALLFATRDSTTTSAVPIERLRISSDGTHNHIGNRIVNSQTLNDSHRTAEPSLRFDGSNDYVDTNWGIGYYPNKGLTISGWVKAAVGNTNMMWLAATTGTDNRLYLATYGGLWDFGYGTTGWASGSGQVAVVADIWTHVVFVDNGTNATLYVNGVGTVTKSSESFSLYSDLHIGRYGTANNYNWDGEIKDVRIHNRALEDTEVAAAYNGESTPFEYADVDSTELLPNPSMETEGSWTYSSFGTGSTHAPSTTQVHGGSYSSKVVVASGGDDLWAASSLTGAGAITQGKTYRFSAWVYSSVVGTAKLQIAHNGVSTFSAANTTVNAWEQISMNITATNTSSVTVYFHPTSTAGTHYVDDLSFVAVGEVAAYTPRSIDCRTKLAVDYKWLDTTSNANHGTISGATLVGDNDHLGVLLVKGRSDEGDRDLNDSGMIKLGDTAAWQARIDYNATGSTHLYIDNAYNSTTAKTSLGMKTATARLSCLEVTGDGTVKATNAGGALQQVARVWKQDFTLATTETYEVITHNLNTANIVVSVRTNPSANDTGEMVEVAIKTGDNSNNTPLNKCTLTFASAPAANTNYTATIIG